MFVKRSNERREHVLMKAFLWALYLPTYADLLVEVPVDDRYKPDVVSLDRRGEPRFWGEAGHVSPRKGRSLVRRYRGTHFAIAKWDTDLDPFVRTVRDVLDDFGGRARIDLLRFPPDSAERFIGERGRISLRHEDLDWRQLR